jgi:hypothetical protein
MSRAARVGALAALALTIGCGRTKPAMDAAAAVEASAPEAAPEVSDAPLDADTPAVDGAAAVDVGDAVAETVDPDFVPGPHAAMPQIRNQGGPVIAHPVLTAITFAGYDLLNVAEQIISSIGVSSYWRATTSEYGVGAATAGPPVRLATPAPATIDDVEIQSWLASMLDGTRPELGAPTQDSIYVIYYPATTTVTNATLKSCASFGGYHGSVWIPQGDASGLNVAYVVVPECEGSFGMSTSTQMSSSHELVEAATDPFGTTKIPGTAWSDVDEDHFVWQVLLGGGEVTDLCQLLSRNAMVPQSYGFAVERSWSNAAARAGRDPCVPAWPDVYVSAAAVLPDVVTLHAGGFDHTTKGVRIAVGASRTVDVQLWSEVQPPPGTWTVTATDMTPLLGGPADSLTFSWDANRGTNGTTLHLTISVQKPAGPVGGQAFMLTSEGAARHEWFGYVAQK